MKIHSILAALVLSVGLASCSTETVSHDVSVLPQKARTLISQNFTSGVSLVEIEKSAGSVKEYEVTLTNGSEISFTGGGEWKSIDTPNNIPVPQGLVPTSINKYVEEKHAGVYIVGIEKDNKGFEVDLSNGVEIEFDSMGNFIKYDK